MSSPAIGDIDNDSIPEIVGSYPGAIFALNWEPNGLSSGIYFAKLTSAGESITHKLLFIK